MQVQRKEGWEHKLRLFLEAKDVSAFAWGSNDCCSFVCEWIHLASGTDVYADFRATYDSALSAYKAIKTITGGIDEEAAAEYVTGKFGMPEVPVLMAQRGDVVLFDSPDGKRLGVVSLNPTRAVFLTPNGIAYERTDACIRAWRV